MNETLKTMSELIICFFSCVGIIYFLRDVFALITRKKKRTCATVFLDLTANPSPLAYILKFTEFYHDTYAERYIDKIVVQVSDAELIKLQSELCETLKIPLVIQRKTEEERNDD